MTPGLEAIDSVPIHIILAEADENCPVEKAQTLREMIPAAAKPVYLSDPAATHNTFAAINDQDFVNLLITEIDRVAAPQGALKTVLSSLFIACNISLLIVV